MLGSSSSASDGRGTMIDGANSMNAVRCIARERQKKELRRERDALLVRLARDLGERGLAESFGVARPVIGKLLAYTRARLDASGAQHGTGEIVVRRISADHDRCWAEADAHYEALGSGPTITAGQRVVTGADTRPDGERR